MTLTLLSKYPSARYWTPKLLLMCSWHLATHPGCTLPSPMEITGTGSSNPRDPLKKGDKSGNIPATLKDKQRKMRLDEEQLTSKKLLLITVYWCFIYDWMVLWCSLVLPLSVPDTSTIFMTYHRKRWWVHVLDSAVFVALSAGLQATVWTRPPLCKCLLCSHSCVREKKGKVVS